MKLILPIQRPVLRWLYPRSRRWVIPSLMFLAALPVYAQSGSDPWENAVNVLKTAFTGTIATGLSLVAIVVGGLIFAYGEGQSKKTIAGIVFGVGMAIGAVKVLPIRSQDVDHSGHCGFSILVRDRSGCAPRLLSAERTLRRQGMRCRSSWQGHASIR